MSETDNIRLPEGSELVISSSPHIHSGRSVRSVMLKVVAALLPAAAAGVWWFGLDALRVLLLSMAFAVFAEAVWCRIARKPVSIGDCSALLSGLLLGMNLPPWSPWWVCLIGAVIAMWLGKQVFGGLGHNLFNPVLVARVALLIALPAIMTPWKTPRQVEWAPGHFQIDAAATATPLDALATATPLGEVKLLAGTPEANSGWSDFTGSGTYLQYAIGNKGGCVGETSGVALAIGGLMLLAWGIIKWQIPVFFICTVMAVTGMVNFFAPGLTPPAPFHLLTGGLLLGAIFMATDTVTSPITGGGRIFFGIGCGVITAVIRVWGNYPEGISFAILLMNAATPLLDRACRWRPFGYTRRRAVKAEAK